MNALLCMIGVNIVLSIACIVLQYLLHCEFLAQRKNFINANKPIFTHANKQLIKVIKEVNKE